MDDIETRTNNAPESPTTVVHEARTLFFTRGETPVVAKWTIEYQPDRVLITEDALDDIIPHFVERTPDEAAQRVFDDLRTVLYPDTDDATAVPLLVTLDYDIGEGLYENHGEYPNTVSVGRFQ